MTGAAARPDEPASQPVGPDRFSLDNRRRLSGPGLRAFMAIADAWGLAEAERLKVLGFPGRSTYYDWLARARAGGTVTLSADTLARISAVLGIWKALRIVFPRDADALEWLKSPNAGPLFGGQRPLDLLTSGSQDAIMLVRRHLDAWRGGVFSAPRPGEQDPPLTDGDIVWA